MTPKEKAQELVARYDVLQTFIENFNQHHSRECALIAVDEIIKANPHSNPFNTDVSSTMAYWNAVRKEIETFKSE